MKKLEEKLNYSVDKISIDTIVIDENDDFAKLANKAIEDFMEGRYYTDPDEMKRIGREIAKKRGINWD